MIYADGQDVLEIDKNKTWKKRKENVEMLAKGEYLEEESTETTESNDIKNDSNANDAADSSNGEAVE